jgi:hypothetical protein
MLCTYAPLETMDSAGEPRCVCGAGCRDLQMDRRTGRGPLFRSVGAWRPKDLYEQSHGGGIGRTVELELEPECAGTGDPGLSGETGLQHHCDYIAVLRTIIFRRRAHWTVTWHLNGQELADQGPGTTQFTLPHMDRGTYAIAATVTDPKSGESQSTPSVTFYVRQPSALSPQHRTP